MNAVTSLLLGLFAGNAVLSQYPPQQPPPPLPPQGGLTPPQGPVYGQPPAQPGFGGYPPQQPGFGGGAPGFGAPGFGAPGFGAFNPAFMDPQTLNCEFPGQCTNRRITLTPSHDFQLQCQQPGVCNGLDLTLNVGYDPLNPGSGVSQIESLDFDAPTRGVTVRINAIPGQNVEVNHIRCNQLGSCTDLNVIAGFGVEIWNIQVDCQMGACVRCKVNGMDCNMLSFQHGNNNNMAFGYYNNAPGYGMGGYPQQPGFGGQPQPASPYGQPQPQYPQYGAPQQPPQQPQGPPPGLPAGPAQQGPPPALPAAPAQPQGNPAAPQVPATQVPNIPPMPQVPPHLI